MSVSGSASRAVRSRRRALSSLPSSLFAALTSRLSGRTPKPGPEASGGPSAPPALDIVDETFIAVPPSTVAAAFADPRSWTLYWPDLVLEVYTDRGDEGLRWTVRGALVGTMEIWLEPVLDGTLLHYFLRASPHGSPTPRALRREFDRRARAAKAIALELKNVLEDGRTAGIPPRHGSL